MPWLRRYAQPISIVLIIGVGLIHRLMLFWLHFPDLHHLIAQNPAWLTWQYLTVAALTEHLWPSILYLQQTPPIPNILLGLAGQAFGWPFGTAYALIALQGLLSISTAIILFRLLVLINGWVYVNAAIALMFLLSTDLIVMEYNALGQTFYENLAMLLLTLAAYLYYQLLDTDKAVYALLLGLTTALLALSRASYSFFLIVPLVFILLGTKASRARHLIAFLSLVVLLHVGWGVKNYVIYDNFSLSTSSWAGLNFAIGLARAGMWQEFMQSILSEADRYPEWFVRMLKDEGLVHWHPPRFQAYVPQHARRQDEQIQALLHNTNRSENSIGQKLVSDLYMKAYVRFLFKHPNLVFKKFTRSYKLFYQPIRNYSAFFLGPLYVEPKVTNGLNIGKLWQGYFTSGPERQYLMRGTLENKDAKEAHFYALPYLPILALMINILVLHTVAPLLILYDGIQRLRRKTAFLSRYFYFLLACYVYAALIMNIAEHGENMRFRLSVEPVIWLISVYTLTRLTQLFTSIWRGRTTSV